MNVFDRIDASKLERRDAQLWVLTIAMLLIFAAGLALLAYPAVFSDPVSVSGIFLRNVFLSFCVLSLLLVGYLIERQVVVRRLRKRLAEEQTRASRMLSQASAELLETLPGLGHFQDRLAMEFRRASNLQQSLSLLIVNLKLAREIEGSAESHTAYGDAAKAMVRKLRGEDSIYLFAPGVFGILLPGVRGVDAHRVADRLADGLHDASGAGARFAFDLRVVNFPEHVAAAREMEQLAVSYVNLAQRPKLAA